MKLWIDTDAGVDDSTAILLALNAPDVEIVGISCVGGNAHLDNVIKNVNRTLLVFGKKPGHDIPIYAGCKCALVHPPMVIPEIHGQDGLGDIKNEDFQINENDFKCDDSKHATQALIDCASKCHYSEGSEDDDGLVLLTLGPLTNIAIALRLAPEKMINGIKKIIVMGGAEDGIGNTSPYAEFNFRCDPEAAQIVFSTFPQERIFLASWTLTQAFSFKTQEDLKLYQSNHTNTKIGEFIKQTWQSIVDFTHGDMLMADPLASFIACYPQYVLEVEKLRINIVLSGEKVGMSEVFNDEKNEGATTIVKKIDFDKYKEVFLNLMKHH